MTGQIVFARAGGRFQDETIFVAQAGGEDERQVNEPGVGCCPRWTPDGKAILGPAMDRDGTRITTGYYSLDGKLIRRLPLPVGLNLGAGAISRDGSHLLFEGWSEDGMQDGVYVGDSNAGHLVRLTKHHDPVIDFSPDGRVVFFLVANPSFPSIGDQAEGSIWRVNIDGSALTRVTPADLPVEAVGSVVARVSQTDGRLVFTSDGAIWTVGADGSVPALLWKAPDGRLAITPTWSPDGAMIMFGLDPAGSLATVDAAPSNGLYVMRADGSGLFPIIETSDWKREPEWIDP